jgi:hypothetical protein
MFSRTGRKLAERGAHTSRSGRISIRPFVHQPNAVDSESYSTPCMSTTATSTLNERAQFVDNDGSDTVGLFACTARQLRIIVVAVACA